MRNSFENPLSFTSPEPEVMEKQAQSTPVETEKENGKDLSLEQWEQKENIKSLETVPAATIEKTAEKLRQEGRLTKPVYNFLKKWSRLGLMALSLAYGSAVLQEKDILDQEKNKEKISKVDETLDPSAVPEIVIYGHRDAQTDAMLNYLSGKSELPENIRKEMEAKSFFSIIHRERDFKDELQEFPALEKFTNAMEHKISGLSGKSLQSYIGHEEYKQDIIAFHLAKIDPAYWDKNKPGNSYKERLDYIRQYLLEEKDVEGVDSAKMSDKRFELYLLGAGIPSDDAESTVLQFDEKKYDAVWTLHQENGNPEMRATERFGKDYKYGRRAYYNAFTNTMFVAPTIAQRNYFSNWMAELSHADQFSKAPYLNSARFIVSCLSLAPSIVKGESLNTAWHSTYHQKGTLENNAHTDIEPRLRGEFEKMTQKDNDSNDSGEKTDNEEEHRDIAGK